MNNFKNLIYDKNDILVAIVIVLIAALVIFNRIDAILAYPSQVTAVDTQSHAVNPEKKDANVTSAAVDPQDNEQQKKDTDKKDTSKKNTKKVVNYSVYIEYGASASSIADTLLGVELIKDKQQFYDAIAAAGAESKLQAGTFIIPSDSTIEEIVAIITK